MSFSSQLPQSARGRKQTGLKDGRRHRVCDIIGAENVGPSFPFSHHGIHASVAAELVHEHVFITLVHFYSVCIFRHVVIRASMIAVSDRLAVVIDVCVRFLPQLFVVFSLPLAPCVVSLQKKKRNKVFVSSSV